MALNIDEKFEGKLTCAFKNDMKNMQNFHQSTWKSPNWDFDGILLSKVENLWAENSQGSYLSWQWRMIQSWWRNSKLTWGIWQILISALENLKDLHFNGLFLIEHIMFELTKVQRSYIWWHWILMQNLKENWFVLSKMTWRICQIFVHRLKNSNFILESKLTELNQNQDSKQPDRPDAVWKLYFTLEINE